MQRLARIAGVGVAIIFLLCGASSAYAAGAKDYNYTGTSFNYVAHGTEFEGIAFSPDGATLYLTSGCSSNYIYQYALSTPWDISTATYVQSKSLYTTGPAALHFSSDGTKMYINEFYYGDIREYTLSTPWDISTAVSTTAVGLPYGNNYTFTMSADGTKLYDFNSYTNLMYEYTLGTAWDLSTMSGSATATHSATDSYYMFGAAFSSDGSNLFLVRTDTYNSSTSIREYTLSTPWDISTASAVGSDLTMTNEDSSMYGLDLNPSNNDLYTIGQYPLDEVFWYSTSAPDISPPSVSLTAPADGATVSGSSVTLSANASDNQAVAGVTFYINGVKEGSEITASPYTMAWDSTATSSGSKSIVAVARDTSNNYATSTSVTVSDENSAPTTDATNLSFTSSQQQMDLSWTNGDGSHRVVFMAATTTAGTAAPVDGTTYSANAAFANGDQIGSTGWYAVYSGTGSSVSVSGLTPGTTYRVQVVEYDGAAGYEKYLATSASGNPASQTTSTYTAPSTAATSVSAPAVSGGSSTVSWTSGNGSYRIVFMEEGTSGSPTPADGTTYAANAAFGSGDQIGSTGWYAVYSGTGSNVTVSGLSASTAYRIQVVEYNGTAGYEKYQTASAPGNPAALSAHTAATIYADYTKGSDATGDGSSGSPYKTFTKAYAEAADGDTIDLSGTFTWTNSDETGDASGSGFTIGKNITIEGQSATSTVLQAASTANTASARVFTIPSGVNVTIQDLGIRYGKSSSGGGGIYENSGATLTLSHVDLNNNRAYYYYGGGLYIMGTTTISHSSIRGNSADYYGGGAYVNNSSAQLIVTDSTFTGNACGSGYYGGAIFLGSGTVWLTNATVTGSTGYYGAIYLSSGALYLKNSIVTNNSMTVSAHKNIDRSSGTVTSGGYNIVGPYGSGDFTPTTGDWTDASGSGTYTLYSVGTTGSLSLASTAIADDTYGTYTNALATGSIGIDEGTTTAQTAGGMTIAIPSDDQRGATRDAHPDIGAYEWVLTDSTPPSVSLTAPLSGATVSGTAVTLSANASDNQAVAGVTFYINGVKEGSEDTSSPYSITWNSTATSSGSKSIVAVARDTSNNYATSTSVSFTVNNEPTPASVTATPNTSSVSIAWTSATAASTRIFFGLTSAYSTSTAEENTSSHTMSHTMTLDDLVPCTLYHYAVTGSTAVDTATSSDATFATAGCTGSADITASGSGAITIAAGGTLNQGVLALTVPKSFTATSSAATFQADKLDGTAFFASASAPSGVSAAGTTVFHLAALTDATTTLSTFDAPITVTLSYTSADVAGLDPSSLTIYRYDGTSWYALDGCTVDTSAKTVSCTTTHFSDFAIFGTAATASPSATTNSSGAILPGYTIPNPLPGESAVPAAASPSASSAPVANSTPFVFMRDLSRGMTGADVRALQEYLDAQGFTLAASGPGAPGDETDYFGPLTKAALVRFQEVYAAAILTPLGLSKGTGYFGPSTRAFVRAGMP